MAECVTLQGVDKDFDEAEEAVKGREADLAEYLRQIRAEFGAGQELSYVTVNKDANLLEIPQVTPAKLTVVTAYDADAFTDALPNAAAFSEWLIQVHFLLDVSAMLHC